MGWVQNIMSSIFIAPIVTLVSCLSLVSLQRGVEWVQNISHTPQKGTLRQIKPYIKRLDVLLERILGGVKFEVTTTDILLMAVVVLLIAHLLEEKDTVRLERAPSKPKKE